LDSAVFPGWLADDNSVARTDNRECSDGGCVREIIRADIRERADDGVIATRRIVITYE